MDGPAANVEVRQMSVSALVISSALAFGARLPALLHVLASATTGQRIPWTIILAAHLVAILFLATGSSIVQRRDY